MTDLDRAYKALKEKATEYTLAFQYADGNQPLKYSTNRLQEAFRDLTTAFSQNWVSVVLNSALDRMKFKGWSVDDTSQNDQFAEIYDSQQIGIEGYDAHKAALVTSEAFIIAWMEDDGIEVYYNDPRMCHVFYDADNPKQKEYAAKWYKDSENKYHMTLYYEDRLEYYETAPVKQVPSSAGSFKASDPETAPNPYGVIPVFHFSMSRHSDVSELTNIVTLQDAVNKLFADMMVSAEFGAFKQRYIISNADIKTLRNAPNEIWQLPTGDGVGQGTQVGEFGGTPLDNYLNAIDKLANSIAIISRTPKHYFYASGSSISGEALIAMEAPLIAKVEHYEEIFGVTWKELGSFLMLLQGEIVAAEDIELVWSPAQSVQPQMEANTLKTLKETGVPLDIALRWAGKTEKEIKEITDLLKKEKADAATQASLMIEKIRAQNAQSNQADPDQNTNALKEADNPNAPPKGVTPPQLQATQLPPKNP